MSSLLLQGRAEPIAFRPDPRFDVLDMAGTARSAPDVADRIRIAEAEAFERGLAEGEAAAELRWQAQFTKQEIDFAQAISGLERVTRTDTDALAERLHATVLALCEEAIMPLAIDAEGLARRARAAADLLRRKFDERTVRMHPQDAAIVAPLLEPDLKVEPDPAIERGGLRIDTEEGGIEDGPALWRQRLAEAFGQC